MFGAIWVGGRIGLVRIDGNMDAEMYLQMLHESVVPELQEAFPNNDWIW